MATQFAGHTTATLYERSIKYDRHTRDYGAWLNGELVGYFGTYQQAEAEMDSIVYDLLSARADEEADAAEEQRELAALVDASEAWYESAQP